MLVESPYHNRGGNEKWKRMHKKQKERKKKKKKK